MEIIKKIFRFFNNAEKVFDDPRIKQDKKEIIIIGNGVFYILSIAVSIFLLFMSDFSFYVFFTPFLIINLFAGIAYYYSFILAGNATKDPWMGIKLIIYYPYTGPYAMYIILKKACKASKTWPKKIWHGPTNAKEEKK